MFALALAFLAGCVFTVAAPVLYFYLHLAPVDDDSDSIQLPVIEFPSGFDPPYPLPTTISKEIRSLSLDSNPNLDDLTFDDKDFDDTDDDSDGERVKVGWVQVLRKPLDRHTVDFIPPNTNSSTSVNASVQATTFQQSTTSNSSVFNIIKSNLTKRSSTLSATTDKPKGSYHFCVLKHNVLFLYSDDSLLECSGILMMSLYEVSLYPTNIDDEECFMKDLPIFLRRKDDVPNDQGSTDRDYFVYAHSAIEKEDWFLSLRHASNLNETLAPPTFASDLIKLVRQLHSNPAHTPLQWFNAIAGRIFLSISSHPALKARYIQKLHRKLGKLPIPSFIDSISVSSLSFGDSIPIITNPVLLKLSRQGEMQLSMDLFYTGGFRIELSTNVRLILGDTMSAIANRFTNTDNGNISIPILFSLQVFKLEGKIKLLVRKPPSNRVWIGFYEMPKIEMRVEPVISDKQVKMSLVLEIIERKIREAIQEAMVLPNMDDFCFFETPGHGGIFPDLFDNLDGSATPDPGTSGSSHSSFVSENDMEDRPKPRSNSWTSFSNPSSTKPSPESPKRRYLRPPTSNSTTPPSVPSKPPLNSQASSSPNNPSPNYRFPPANSTSSRHPVANLASSNSSNPSPSASPPPIMSTSPKSHFFSVSSVSTTNTTAVTSSNFPTTSIVSTSSDQQFLSAVDPNGHKSGVKKRLSLNSLSSVNSTGSMDPGSKPSNDSPLSSISNSFSNIFSRKNRNKNSTSQGTSDDKTALSRSSFEDTYSNSNSPATSSPSHSRSGSVASSSYASTPNTSSNSKSLKTSLSLMFDSLSKDSQIRLRSQSDALGQDATKFKKHSRNRSDGDKSMHNIVSLGKPNRKSTGMFGKNDAAAKQN
ncbi:putative integral membrane protein conserved region-domain-containing protein [Paraphysoderma sedebokerense]|nr:putative integral membrane protein conserved region-domain-containing protein [Paraphysoderma sedebokerense]